MCIEASSLSIVICWNTMWPHNCCFHSISCDAQWHSVSFPSSLFRGYRQWPSNESHVPGSSLTCSHKISNSPMKSPELLDVCNPSLRSCHQCIRGLTRPHGWCLYTDLAICPSFPLRHLKTVALWLCVAVSVTKHFFQLLPFSKSPGASS